MMPGRTLHRLATHICSATTLERVVEPAIADLQKEYGDARHMPHCGWILLSGYLAIVKVIAICALSVASAKGEERRELMGALAWSSAMFLVITALLIAFPMYDHAHSMDAFGAMWIAAQAVPLAIPLGTAFGLAFGLSARITTNAAKITIVGALAASVLSLWVLAWVMPAVSSASRESSFRALRARGYDGPATTSFQKAYSEMTLGELRNVIAHFSTDGELRIARRYAFGLHQRFALAAATLALVSLLIAAPVQHRGWRGVLAFGACLTYWALLFAGDLGSRRGYLPPPIGAWLPNVALIATAILIASSRSSRLRGSVNHAQ